MPSKTTTRVSITLHTTSEPQPPRNKYQVTCEEMPGIVIEADEHDEAVVMAGMIFKDLLVISMNADHAELTSITKVQRGGN